MEFIFRRSPLYSGEGWGLSDGLEMDLGAYLKKKRTMIDEALRRLFPDARGPATEVIRAMHYSLSAGGNPRIVSIVILEACDYLSIP